MEARSEIRLVTCLFVDVVGSTDAMMELGPERMQRLLRNAFTEISGIVAAQGGVVEKYVGDAILAIFGLPTSHADDAERALRAADACVRWSSASAASGAALAVRAGVETGTLLADLSAVEERQRMVVGESINLAARLQAVAEPGQVVVGPRCHEAVAAIADFERLGAVPLKGFGEVEAWRFNAFRTGEVASDLPFVGREVELAALRQAFARAEQSTAQLALIIGPAGQGKSRLAAEALRQAAPSTILQARCRPGTETGANAPLRQLLESDIPSADPASVRDRVSALVGGADGEEVAAALCHSSGLAVEARMLAISRYEQRELIARAWQAYLEAMARDQLVAVLVEDLHWADPVTQRVADQISAEAKARLVVVATARPEYDGALPAAGQENPLRIELGPMDEDSLGRLVQLAGSGESAGSEASLQRAAGNPLFAIELARSRSRSGELPVNIQAAIAARLDELPADERELLQRASVAGETFEVPDAALLGKVDATVAASALGRIARLGFLVPAATAYRFHHILVRDVAYGRLPVVERMALHARFAAEGADEDDVERQAHHWWEALKPPDAEWVWEDRERLAAMRSAAYRVHMAAGDRLEQRNLYEQATDVYLHAAELADAGPDRAAAMTSAGRAYARLGRGDDGWSLRLDAIRIYRDAEIAPPARLYADMLDNATFNWGYFHNLPDDGEVLQLLDEGARLARVAGDDVSLARLLAQRSGFTGDVTGTEQVWELLHGDDPVRFGEAAQRLGTVFLWAGRIKDS
ncbi:MAG TPA: adenylate/guanylate cyclase domain-containing protein, partial [Candidatus Limnocylindria bacterium]